MSVKQNTNQKQYYKKYQQSSKGKKAAQKGVKKYESKIKKEAYYLLGNRCANPDCLVPGGCADIRCLQLDHIDGGGSRERREKGFRRVSGSYREIIKNPKLVGIKYQLLCANCNWIKRVEEREFGGGPNNRKC